MPTEEIGFEILPNVYISKVILNSAADVSYYGVAHVYVRDAADDDMMPYWSHDERIMNNMKIMFMSAENQAYAEAISRGFYNVADLMKLPAVSSGGVTAQYTKINNCKRVVTKHGIFFKTSFKFYLNPMTSNQAIFCCLVMDSKMMSSGNNIVDKYTMDIKGPTTSEYIIKDSNIVLRSNVFLKANNEQWAGPVHYHPTRGFMEGAMHSDKPHGILTKIPVHNFKIINNIKFNFKPKNFVNKPRNMPFTSLWYSLKSRKSLAAMFGVNYKNIILRHTKYGYNLNNLEDREFRKIINNLRIENLSLIRHKVRTYKNKKHLTHSKIFESKRIINSYTNNDGTFREARLVKSRTRHYDNLIFPESLISREESRRLQLGGLHKRQDIFIEDLAHVYTKSTIKELYLNMESGMKFYHFTDNQFGEVEKGQFKYEVKLDFIDPTIKYVENLMKEAKLGMESIEGYLDRVLIVDNYDYHLESIRDDFYTEELVLYDNVDEAPWIKVVKNYVRYLNFFYDLTETETEFLLSTSFSKVHPKVATLGSIKSFISEYRKILKNLYTHFDISTETVTKSRSSNNKSRLKKEPLSNLVSVSKIFKEIVDTKNYKIFYNFFSESEQSDISIYSRNDLSPRIADERSQYVLSGSEVIISPASVQSHRKIIDIFSYNLATTNPNDIFTEEYIRSVNEMFGNVEQKIENLTVSVEPPQSYETVHVEQDLPLIESTKILGDDTKFNQYRDDNDLCQGYTVNLIETSGFTFDLAESMSLEPVFENMTNVDPVSPQMEADIITLIGIKKTAIIPMIKHMNIQKIQILAGFEETSDGHKMTSIPIWRDMTNQDLAESNLSFFCRIVPLWDGWTDLLSANEAFKKTDLPIKVDKYFFISDFFGGLNTPPGLTPSSLDQYGISVANSLEYNIDLSTSNIVRQNIKVDAEKQPMIGAQPPEIQVPFRESINVVGQLGGVGGETTGGVAGFTGSDTNNTGEVTPSANTSGGTSGASSASGGTSGGGSASSGGGSMSSGGGSMSSGGGY